MRDQVQQSSPCPLPDVLTSCCRRLQQSLDDVETPASVLSARSQALAVVDLMRQVLEQAPVDAVGADFVSAASWLARWYAEQAAALASMSSGGGLLLGADGKAASPSVPQQVVEATSRSAAVWAEVVGALPSSTAGATSRGVLRVWTNTVAALATMLTQSAPRSRQEAVALMGLLGSTAREAAAMAAGLPVGEAASTATSMEAHLRSTLATWLVEYGDAKYVPIDEIAALLDKQPCDSCGEPSGPLGDGQSYCHSGCAGYPYCQCRESHRGDCGVGVVSP